MIGDPAISVVMAVYDEERQVGRAIESILAQDFGDFEFLVVDDGSRDGTAGIVGRYQEADPRVRPMRKPNTGLVDSLNLAIAQARGRYIARLDADDEAHPTRLGIQFNEMEKDPRLLLLGSWCRMVNRSSGRSREFRPPVDYASIRRYMLRDNPIIHSSVMVRTHVVMRLGGYRDVRWMEDYDLWVRVAAQGKVENLPLFLVTRSEEGNLHHRPVYAGADRGKILAQRLRCQREAHDLLGDCAYGALFRCKTRMQLARWRWARRMGKGS